MGKSMIDISHLADLARIDLSAEETARFAMELERILSYVEQLQVIPTDGVAETAQVTGLLNILREDMPKRQKAEDKIEDLRSEREKLLQAVPEIEQRMVKVPAILVSE